MTRNIAASVRQRIEDQGPPVTLREAIQVIAAFLLPVTQALSEGRRFDRWWRPRGPWLPRGETSEQRHG